MFYGPSYMMIGPTKGRTLHNVITHNVIWTSRNTEPIVCRWISAHAMFDGMCSPLFVGASNVI